LAKELIEFLGATKTGGYQTTAKKQKGLFTEQQ
jgi:hypothetical protein